MDSHDQISVVESLACLGDLPLEQMSALIEVLEPRRIPARQSIYREGEPSDLVFFIGAGRLAMMEGDLFRGHVVRGEVAGWNSFFHACPRDHSLVAEKDCLIYALKRRDLDALVAAYPVFLSHFLGAVTPVPATGIDRSALGIKKQVGIFLFEDLRSEAKPIFDGMMSTFARMARVTRYTCDDFCRLGGLPRSTEGLHGAVASDLFAQLESENDVIFYTVTSDDPIAWAQKVAGQVDTLILAVRDDTGALPGWFGEFVKRDTKDLGLVLVRTGAGAFDPRSLNIWKAFEPDWHYRVHLRDTRRWRSIARMALGRAVNLVLAGGGSLGAIHCGIIKALHDGDFPIDTIGGTSVGACISIGYALGETPEELTHKFRTVFVDRNPFKAYTLPLYSLINPTRFDQAIREMAEGRRLEESMIPVHATVTNLSRAMPEVVTTGPAWEAMRMTASLPGILPPYIRDGCAYVDGSVTDNFPIMAAHERYEGRYVGVTFRLPTDRRLRTGYADMPGPFGAALTRLHLRGGDDFPRLGDVLAGSMMLNSTSSLQDAVNRADLLLHPPVPPNISITSFDRFEELYEIGLEYGTAYVADLKAGAQFDEISVFPQTKPTESDDASGN